MTYHRKIDRLSLLGQEREGETLADGGVGTGVARDHVVVVVAAATVSVFCMYVRGGGSLAVAHLWRPLRDG